MAQIKTIEAWCCGISADHELGNTHIVIYPTKESCLNNRNCSRVDQGCCAPRKLTITFETSCFTQEQLDHLDSGLE